MRKTLLLFTTMALALLLAAGMALAADARPTVVTPGGTVPADNATGVLRAADITVKFSEAMRARSINPNTFYILKGDFTAQSATQNPKRFCVAAPVPPSTTPTLQKPCPAAIPAPPTTVSYNANTLIATLNPFGTSTTLLDPNTKYTVVVEGTGDGDNVAVKDTGGNPLLTAGTGDYIFHFTTGAS